jgi:peptidyl-prolyl cis-trans isomerase B (cyclophilin B)
MRTRTRVLVYCSALAAPAASAQLKPERTYYGVDRPIPMTVMRPAGAEGGLTVQLLAPPAGQLVSRADVPEGLVNLATLFPELWRTDTPKLLYAQLVAGERRVGPPVVLQPLLNPRYAAAVDQTTKMPKWVSPPASWGNSGLRAYVDKHVLLDTSLGEIELAMRPDTAPNTAWNFLALVEGGFYTDILFHRVVGARGGKPPFVIQVGDPTAKGDGGPGYMIDLEDSPLPHDFGVISMARDADPNTAGSQVFICLSREATKRLDGLYTAFGQAVRGGEVIQAIGAVPLERGPEGQPGDRPTDPPVLRSARVVDAPPYGEGPGPVKPAPEKGAER